jgi:2-polyprenyl-3-methyl-5-hydroxy-6-metoxy-1,4-benzoquinol methylase
MKLRKIDLCPLCESIERVVVDRIPYQEIWKGLEEEWKAVFSKNVIEDNSPCEMTTLVECKNCGLQYFVPVACGNFQFYYELSQSPIYYCKQKWEFLLVGRNLRSKDYVLDIGCGNGGFLESIPNQVNQAIGIDTNAEAIKCAKKKGLDARFINIEEFSEENEGKFDIVCCFHVIEHLEHINPFLKAAISCLKPGGTLILSAPNRDRIIRRDFESLDFPPHHISRWQSNQFDKLADIMGIKLDRIVSQIADRSACHKWLREKIAYEVLNEKYKLNMFIGKIASFVTFLPPLYKFYGMVGLLEKLGLFQLSILAFYKKGSP